MINEDILCLADICCLLKIQCNNFLQNNFIYRVIFRPSKQVFLSEVQQPFDLPDGTASFMDFSGNKNNRYLTSEQAQKNRVQPPSKVSKIIPI